MGEIERWMEDHPNDTPCPSNPDKARMWRHKRGIIYEYESYEVARQRAKYEAAIAETRAHRALRVNDND